MSKKKKDTDIKGDGLKETLTAKEKLQSFSRFEVCYL